MRSTPSAARRKPNGSLVPVGRCSMAKYADKCVDLVGKRERLTGLGRRQGVSRKSRPIVLLDRKRHFLRIALRLGVVAAHDALQFREFADHGGHQIGLGEFGGARNLGSGADALPDDLRERFHAARLVGIAAELGLKGHARGGWRRAPRAES